MTIEIWIPKVLYIFCVKCKLLPIIEVKMIISAIKIGLKSDLLYFQLDLSVRGWNVLAWYLCDFIRKLLFVCPGEKDFCSAIVARREKSFFGKKEKSLCRVRVNSRKSKCGKRSQRPYSFAQSNTLDKPVRPANQSPRTHLNRPIRGAPLRLPTWPDCLFRNPHLTQRTSPAVGCTQRWEHPVT